MIQIKSDTNMSLSATYLTLLVIICVCLLTNKQMVASKAAIGADSDDAVINLFVENAEDIDVIINVVQLPATENCDCENCTCEASQEFSETTTSKLTHNCDDIYNSGHSTDGVYTVFTGKYFVEVYCEFEKEDGKNWMVIQRRMNGEVDFYLNWTDYVNGFGNKDGEFWLGLQPMHEITDLEGYRYRLRVDIEDWEGGSAYAEYSTFLIGIGNLNYPLAVYGYTGNAGDSLSYHNGRPFSTKDRDNDELHINCAESKMGGWWFKSCEHSQLNGRYRYVASGSANGLIWYHWKDTNLYSMKTASMKIRPN